jgi:HSP20 family protein
MNNNYATRHTTIDIDAATRRLQLHMGETWFERGKLFQAVDAYLKINEEYPDSAESEISQSRLMTISRGYEQEGLLRLSYSVLKRLQQTITATKRSGVFDVDAGVGKNTKADYGFSMKAGLDGDQEPRIEPFGNVHRDEKTSETTVQEVSEPLVDVIEENDHILVLVQMPDFTDINVHLELNGDILVLHAEKGSKKYHKEILLPCSFESKAMEKSCRNGILEVKLKM